MRTEPRAPQALPSARSTTAWVALRFYQNKAGQVGVVTPPFTTAHHVAIQDESVFIGRKQIDNNFDNDCDHNGPRVRDFNAGVGDPTNPLASYWNNGISRAPAGEVSSQSILQEMDGE